MTLRRTESKLFLQQFHKCLLLSHDLYEHSSLIPEALLPAQCFVLHHLWQFSHTAVIYTQQLVCHYLLREGTTVSSNQTTSLLSDLLRSFFCNRQKLLDVIRFLKMNQLVCFFCFLFHLTCFSLDLFYWMSYFRIAASVLSKQYIFHKILFIVL